MVSLMFNEKQQNEICNLYINNNLSSIKIAKLFNCNPTTIQKILKNKNISRRTNKEYQTKYVFNYNFFDNINTEEKAYWLGFSYAIDF